MYLASKKRIADTQEFGGLAYQTEKEIIMNIIAINGNVVATPECGMTKDGKRKYAHFRIAHNNGKNKDGTDKTATFLYVSAFGDSANFVAQYLKKGSNVEVYGSLSIETREKDGKTYTNVCINADRVGFYGFRTKEDKGGDTKKK